MHRFMRHLDDLAGLDLHIDTARRGRSGMQHQGGWGVVETLRRVVAGRGVGVKRNAMCRGDLIPAARSANASPYTRPDHVPPGSFHRR